MLRNRRVAKSGMLRNEESCETMRPLRTKLFGFVPKKQGSKNEGLNADDDVEWVELVEIPEDVPEKPKVQLKISDYFSAL